MGNIEINIPEGINYLTNKPYIGIKFLNGEVVIPNRSGGYVVASGCGSGKTTAIRELIKKYYNYGVVYSAFTIEECNKMYEYCKSIIPEEDIILLHSNTQDDGVDLNILRNHPEQLADKKVIICTHYKLLNEHPSVYQRYNKNIVNIGKRYSSLKRDGISGCDQRGMKVYPRQLILVDEMPTCQSTRFTITKDKLKLLGAMRLTTYIDDEGIERPIIKRPVEYFNGGDPDLIEKVYSELTDKFLFNESTESGRLKNELALGKIYDEYDLLINSKQDKITITYTLADMLCSESDMRVIIFDGTGDLTFFTPEEMRYRYYSPFTVLSYPNKYNSPIGIHKVEMGYKRSFRTENDFRNYYKRLTDNIDIQINNISDIIKNGHRVLIITWKNLKVKNEARGVPISEFDSREIEYIDHLKNKLNKLGHLEYIDYSIIHYQSGLDRATNEFREYDSVYFLGEFHVPDEVVYQFNQDYRVNTDKDNYTLYQLVQAICRTRIRLHNMSPVDIYFTSDWDDNIITKLRNYLGTGDISEVRDTTLNHIKPKWRPVVELFSSLSSEFKDAIEIEGKTCRIEFTLDEIWDLTREVLPMKAKEVKSYYPLINYLRKFGIEMEVKSTARSLGFKQS